MGCYWKDWLAVGSDGHFDGTQEGIRILAAWRVTILLQQPPSFSETLNAVLVKILRHRLDVRKDRLEYAIEAHRSRTITGASRLGLLVLLACLPSGMAAPRASGAQKPNEHKKQGKPVRVVSIRFGQFGGTGDGYTP